MHDAVSSFSVVCFPVEEEERRIWEVLRSMRRGIVEQMSTHRDRSVQAVVKASM